MNAEQQSKLWGQIVAKAWSDETFKKRLLAEPAVVLKEHGVEVQPGYQVKIVEDTDTLLHLNLPPKPTAEELSEEELANVAGGIWFPKPKPYCPICVIQPLCAPTPDGNPPPSSCTMCS